MYLSEADIVQGYEDGTFRPNNNVTRAEFCKFVLNACFLMNFEAYDEEYEPFVDVDPEDWYYDYICFLHYFDLIDGVSGDTFRPNDPIKRQDMAVILYRFYLSQGPMYVNVLLSF